MQCLRMFYIDSHNGYGRVVQSAFLLRAIDVTDVMAFNVDQIWNTRSNSIKITAFTFSTAIPYKRKLFSSIIPSENVG